MPSKYTTNQIKLIGILRKLIEEEGWNPKEAMRYLRVSKAVWLGDDATLISKGMAKRYVEEYERPMNKIANLNPQDWYRFDHVELDVRV